MILHKLQLLMYCHSTFDSPKYSLFTSPLTNSVKPFTACACTSDWHSADISVRDCWSSAVALSSVLALVGVGGVDAGEVLGLLR